MNAGCCERMKLVHTQEPQAFNLFFPLKSPVCGLKNILCSLADSSSDFELQAINMKKKSFNNAYIIAISFISALGRYLFGFDFVVIMQRQFALDAYWEGYATGSLAFGAINGCLIAGTF